jgi:hypothetical protein
MTDFHDLENVFLRITGLAATRGLANVTRSSKNRTPCLKIADRTFVRLRDPHTLVLHCPIEQKTLLLEISPNIYFETAHYVGYPAVLIRLDEISDEELSLRLEDAWRFRGTA